MQKQHLELFELPNIKLKVVKTNIFPSKNEIDSLIIINKFMNKLLRDDFDVLLILVHLFLNEKKDDGLIYFNTDDILSFRNLKKIKQIDSKPSGYKQTIREKIANSLSNIEKIGIFHKIEYKKFNFAGYFNESFCCDIRKIRIPVELLKYNPYKQPWHKDIGYFLAFYKYQKPQSSIIQIKKLLKNVKNNYSFLAPNEVRTRFEDVMDELAQDSIIENWHYKTIDEEFLGCKNWLYYWSLLSVKIDFKTLANPPCFLNF